MKRLFLSILISICLITSGFVPVVSFAASKTYTKGTLTGGTAGCLDEIDGDDLSEGDRALVVSSTYGYTYYLNATSGAAESSPDVIAPDTNAGNKRWILKHPVSVTSDLNYIVTTMTAAGINTAIVAANAAGGGVVYLTSGTYDCTGATQVDLLDNVDIVGYGAILQGDGGLTQLVYGSSINDVHIYGLELDGQFTGTLDHETGEKGIAIVTGDNITIQDCYIHNFQSRAIEAADLTDTSLINNHIETAGMGIRVISDASDLKINDNQIEDVYAGGITLACDVGDAISDVEISNNLIDTTAAGETLLAQNIVCYSDYSGASHGTISGFTISGNTLIGKDHGCIRLGGDNHVISNNTCDGSEIRISLTNDSANRHESSHIIIEGNKIWNIDDDTTVDDGIFVRDGAYIDIKNNSITGTSGSGCGIFLAYTDVGSVIGNTVQTVGEDGILFQDCTKISCTDNIISAAGTGDTGYGIHLNNAVDDENENISVSQNRFFNCADGDIVNTSAGVNHQFANNGGTDIDMYSNWTNSYIVNKKGTLYLYSNVTDIGVAMIPDSSVVAYFDNTATWRTLATGTRTTGSTSMAEQAAAGTDYAGYGQVWVKTATPNELWFTDDAGTDFQLGLSGGSFMSDLIDDTTPQLGGALDGEGNDIDDIDDIFMDDADRIVFGTSDDMSVFYSGGGGYIGFAEVSTGNLTAYFKPGSSAYLCYDGDIKLSTDSFGVELSDELSINDGNKIYFGTGNDLEMWHSGLHGFIGNDTGNLYIYATGTEDGIKIVPNDAVSLYFDDAVKFATTNTGVYATGTITASGACCADFVFEDDYNLMPLDELQDYIDQNECLPNMTINDTDEVELIQATKELLVKVEENSLYILQLHQQIKFYKFMAFFLIASLFIIIWHNHRRIVKLESK